MKRIERRKWLVLFNCQADGLANSLEASLPGLQVERYDHVAFNRRRDELLARGGEFERVVVAARFRDAVGDDAAKLPNLTWLPHVWFQGYHPDLCYLAAEGPLSSGPTGPYHSAIAWAAFRSGRDEQQTLALYTRETYEALGYFHAWDDARQRLLDAFAAGGIDARERFVQWTRRGPFMHTVNHPRIGVLLDVARLLLRHVGLEPRDTGIVPHDNLVNGPGFPVYPEIGMRLGVAGSHWFKAGGAYRVFGLEQFVRQSFNVYRVAGDAMPENPAFLPMLERARTFIEASR